MMSKTGSSALRDVTNSAHKPGDASLRTGKKSKDINSSRKRGLSPSRQGSPSSNTIIDPQKNDNPTDIDGGDTDPRWVGEYVEQIYEYQRSVELPIPKYMDDQTKLIPRHRGILIDWVMTVAHGADVELETLHLIVRIIDRYFGEIIMTSLDDLQLIAAGAIVVGMKYQECWHYTAQKLVRLCANAYDEDQILDIETRILRALDYRLTFPTAQTFLMRFLKAARKDIPSLIAAMEALSNYTLDTILLSYSMNAYYLPSELAALSVYLARKGLKLSSKHWSRALWSEALLHHTGYSEKKMEGMAAVFARERKVVGGWGLGALKQKYGCVASYEKKLLDRALAPFK